MGAYLSTRSTTSGPRRLVVALLGSAIGLQLMAGVAAAVSLDSRAQAFVFANTAILDRLPAPARTVFPPRPEVAAPVRIDIPSIGVSAPVDGSGLNDDGTLAVPADFTRTGWYEGLEAPGEIGTAVIVGHLDSETGPAVFHRAPKLRAGDEILIARADGSSVRYVVERTEQYDKRRFPIIAVYAPTDRPTLRLITCGGTFDKRIGHYSDNVVVYASAQEAL